MAFYSRAKLPPLKLSVRNASATCRTMLFRGSTGIGEPSSVNVAEDKVKEMIRRRRLASSLMTSVMKSVSPLIMSYTARLQLKGGLSIGKSYCQCSLRVQQCRSVSYVHCAQIMPCIGARSVGH